MCSLGGGANRRQDRSSRFHYVVTQFTVTKERVMLDPKEQNKGGFGAFAQRDRERREAEAKNATPTGAPPAPPAVPPTKDSTTRSDATPGSGEPGLTR